MENQFIPAFEIKDLTYSAKDKTILAIQNLVFEQGRIYSIIGPSGAGKTSLLRILNLLNRPKQGQIKYFGQPTSTAEKERIKIQRSMSMVFQKPTLFSGTVFYNVALALKLHGIKRSERKAMVLEALTTVGISHLAGQNASTVSGGEAQRVALARAIVTKPKVILLDEPTANLDPANVAAIEEVIQNIHKNYHITVIIVTHNLNQARRLSNETIFLNKGEVIEKGVTEQIFTKASEPSTSAFISGEMIY